LLKVLRDVAAMRLPFVISVPHCSYLIPEDLRPCLALTKREIIEATDMGTREIFTNLPVRVTLWSRWSRLVVDLNRSPQARDPKGVVPEIDYYRRCIYRDHYRPDQEEVERRLRLYYWPYHRRLREALQSPEVTALFDCHSLSKIGPPGAPDTLRWRKDIVLGNNGNPRGETEPSRGTITCPPESLQMMKGVFQKWGFSVSINRPYPGGYIIAHYGTDLVRQGKMAVQIEINQDLYLDTEHLRLRSDGVADVSTRLHQVFREIARRL
jgi:N-formylglutamate deformylase